MRNALIALSVAAAAIAGAGEARAATRVAVAPFDGDRTGDIRDTVVELLEEDYRVLPVRDVELGMRKLDLEDGVESKKEMAKLAAELDADAVVVGTVEPDGNKSALKMRMYVKKSKRAFQFSTRFQQVKQVRDSSLRDDFRAKLGPGGGRTIAKGTRDDEEASSGRRDDEGRSRDDEGRARDDEGRARDDEEDDGGRKRSARLSDDEEEGVREGADDEDTGEDDERKSRSTKLARGARKAAIRFEAGMAGSARRLTFTSNLPSDQAPLPYKSNLVPGLRLQGELYPLAFTMPDNIASGLGVYASYEQAIGLTTTVTRNMEATKLDTTSKAWEVAARFRIAWGNRVMNPSITLGVGYGHRDFTFDRGPLEGEPLDVPNVGYGYIAPGLWGRIPLHPTFALVAGGRGLILRKTGGIGKETEYGQAKVLGIDVEAGMEVMIGRYLILHFGGFFTQYGFSYSEATAGEKATNRDGDPADLDVGGARDRYFGGMGTAGVVF